MRTIISAGYETVSAISAVSTSPSHLSPQANGPISGCSMNSPPTPISNPNSVKKYAQFPNTHLSISTTPTMISLSSTQR